jgi:hypothetical protein
MYALKISRYDIPTVKSIVNADIISAVMASWSIRSVLRTEKPVKATNMARQLFTVMGKWMRLVSKTTEKNPVLLNSLNGVMYKRYSINRSIFYYCHLDTHPFQLLSFFTFCVFIDSYHVTCTCVNRAVLLVFGTQVTSYCRSADL